MKEHVSKQKITCENCSKEISRPNYQKHLNYCLSEKSQKPKIGPQKWFNGQVYVCDQCNLVTDNRRKFTSHYWRNHTEAGINHKIPELSKEQNLKKSWNRGLTKESDHRVARIAERSSRARKGKKGKPLTEEHKKKISIRMSLENPGGKCKWYTVAGKKVQGTWERDIALKFEELGIKWYKPKVNKDVWSYIINGKTKSYTPDIYLIDIDIYLEVKGFWWGNDKEKMKAVISQHPDKKLIIIEKLEYEKILRGELVW